MGYDPTLGRFLTRDTYPAYAPMPETLHRYVYVQNNPINHTDPAGLCWLFDSSCTFDRWLKDTQEDADRKFGDWRRDFEGRVNDLRRDPVGSQLRGLRGSVASFADFSARKGVEVSTSWRTLLAANERGDLGGVIRGMGELAANVTLVSDLQRTGLGRVVLNGAVMVGAAYLTGGASVVPTLLGGGRLDLIGRNL